MEEPWVAEAADTLARLTADPMAGAAPGTVTIVEVAAPAGRGRYRECRMRLQPHAPGIAADVIDFEAVLDRRYWPRPGLQLPARISRTHPGVLDVDWDRLPPAE